MGQFKTGNVWGNAGAAKILSDVDFEMGVSRQLEEDSGLLLHLTLGGTAITTLLLVAEFSLDEGVSWHRKTVGLTGSSVERTSFQEQVLELPSFTSRVIGVTLPKNCQFRLGAMRVGGDGTSTLLADAVAQDSAAVFFYSQRSNPLPNNLRTFYVNKDAPSGGGGSLAAPFKTIQAALNAVMAVPYDPLLTYVVNVGPGTYEENLVYNGRQTLYMVGPANTSGGVSGGINYGMARVAPLSGVAFTITNSTLVGLAAYRASGLYADLVNQGNAGPTWVWVQGISFFSVAAGAPNAVECLGVKGDISPTETEFLKFGCTFAYNSYAFAGAGVGYYVKNAGFVYLMAITSASSITGVNLHMLACRQSFLSTTMLSFDSLAADGKYTADTGVILQVDYCYTTALNITVTGPKSIKCRYLAMDTGTLTLNGTGIALSGGCFFQGCRLGGAVNLTSTGGSLGSFDLIDTYIGGAFSAGGAVTFNAKSCRFMSTVSLASGAGTSVFTDCTVIGVITDPDNKLSELYNNKIYVNGSAPAGGNGTFASPFTTIQAALNKAATFNTARTGTPIRIEVAIGVYPENLTWYGQEPIDLCGDGSEAAYPAKTLITPAAGCPFTITNATPASLATYNVSGIYADLVNDGPGPGFVALRNMYIQAAAGVFPGIRTLGVKGDGGAATTSFLDQALNLESTVAYAAAGGGGTVDVFVKNTNIFNKTAGYNGKFQLRNVSYGDISECRLSHIDAEYNALSADGAPAYGLGYTDILNCDFVTSSGVKVAASQDIRIRACTMDTGVLNCDGTAVVTVQGGRIGGAVDLEAGVTLTASGVDFMSTFTAAAGAGVVTLNECDVLGVITDAGGKIIHNDNIKSGVHTFGGAGDGVIDFSALPGIMADFPAGTTYSVTLSCEDTGAGYATLFVKNGSPLVTGFTITAGGACKAHWTARKTN